MINLPRWVTAGPSWVVAVYTTGLALSRLSTSSHLATDLLALALFLAAFVATLRRPMRLATEAWVDLVCVALPVLATIGLDPEGNFAIGGWYVSAITCLAVRLVLHQRTRSAVVTMVALTAQTSIWAGLHGLVGFGVFAVDLLVAVGALCAWAVTRAEAEMAQFNEVEHITASRRAAQDAYQQEREVRLLRVAAVAADELRRIVAAEGRLQDADRAECRLLEQTIRDENRGRALLNDAVRGAVIAARRRGAIVQLIDDGGLDDLSDDALEHLRDRVALAVTPLTSTRIVIRTGAADQPTVTIVATTPDPVAAALGLDDDDVVDLWLTLDAAVPV